MSEGPWQGEDPEPVGVRVVLDGTEDRVSDVANSDVWNLTTHGTWKGRKDDQWVYLSWGELLKRWGTVTLP